jgi:hypothetical protein
MRPRQNRAHHWTSSIANDAGICARSTLLIVLLCTLPFSSRAASIGERDDRESKTDTQKTEEHELQVDELRDMTKQDGWVLDHEREGALEILYANRDLRDDTVEILRTQLEQGFPALPRDKDTGISGAKEGFGLYDPNDEPVIGEKGDFEIRRLFGLESIFSTHSVTGNFISADCTTAGPCVFPAAYDAKAERVYLAWRVSNYSQAALEDHVYQHNGKSLRVYVNGGLPLTQGGPGLSNPQDFHAYVSTSGCGSNQASPCLVAVIARNAWYPMAGPWTPWDLRVELFETQ